MKLLRSPHPFPVYVDPLLCMNGADLLVVMLLYQTIVRILCDQRHRSVLFSISALAVDALLELLAEQPLLQPS